MISCAGRPHSGAAPAGVDHKLKCHLSVPGEGTLPGMGYAKDAMSEPCSVHAFEYAHPYDHDEFMHTYTGSISMISIIDACACAHRHTNIYVSQCRPVYISVYMYTCTCAHAYTRTRAELHVVPSECPCSNFLPYTKCVRTRARWCTTQPYSPSLARPWRASTGRPSSTTPVARDPTRERT